VDCNDLRGVLTAHAAEWQVVLTTQLHADATKHLAQIMARFVVGEYTAATSYCFLLLPIASYCS
jgi:hypothetical protein